MERAEALKSTQRSSLLPSSLYQSHPTNTTQCTAKTKPQIGTNNWRWSWTAAHYRSATYTLHFTLISVVCQSSRPKDMVVFGTCPERSYKMQYICSDPSWSGLATYPMAPGLAFCTVLQHSIYVPTTLPHVCTPYSASDSQSRSTLTYGNAIVWHACLHSGILYHLLPIMPWPAGVLAYCMLRRKLYMGVCLGLLY